MFICTVRLVLQLSLQPRCTNTTFRGVPFRICWTRHIITSTPKRTFPPSGNAKLIGQLEVSQRAKVSRLNFWGICWSNLRRILRRICPANLYPISRQILQRILWRTLTVYSRSLRQNLQWILWRNFCQTFRQFDGAKLQWRRVTPVTLPYHTATAGRIP